MKTTCSRSSYWKFAFKSAGGDTKLSRTFRFRHAVGEAHALSFTTQYVRDNLIQSYTFDHDPHG